MPTYIGNCLVHDGEVKIKTRRHLKPGDFIRLPCGCGEIVVSVSEEEKIPEFPEYESLFK